MFDKIDNAPILPLTVEAEIFAEIGLQSHIAHEMISFYSKLQGVDESFAHKKLRWESFKSITQSVCKLLNENFDVSNKHVKEYLQLSERLFEKNDQRNRYAHSLCGFSVTLDENSATLICRDKDRSRNEDDITLKKLKATSDVLVMGLFKLSFLRVKISEGHTDFPLRD